MGQQLTDLGDGFGTIKCQTIFWERCNRSIKARAHTKLILNKEMYPASLKSVPFMTETPY